MDQTTNKDHPRNNEKKKNEAKMFVFFLFFSQSLISAGDHMFTSRPRHASSPQLRSSTFEKSFARTYFCVSRIFFYFEHHLISSAEEMQTEYLTDVYHFHLLCLCFSVALYLAIFWGLLSFFVTFLCCCFFNILKSTSLIVRFIAQTLYM